RASISMHNHSVTRRSIVTWAAAFALAVLGSGCAETPTTPTNFAPFSQTDLRVGTGGDAANGRILTVHYTGWFYNESRPDNKGPIFDASTAEEPLIFTLASGNVIEGWVQGLVGMRVGGVRRLVIPPSLAYGPARNNRSPPNATLLFEVELIDVQDQQ
ncbi:MAG TPA: FKBP-type peptidyl-prolyl cis-trans isomerase, partial [Vicinamibacterales bacterium]|nr:FKBP-type peptidyl-prolyl cis-trans isomerase [Vicinamibacterales bacterium]